MYLKLCLPCVLKIYVVRLSMIMNYSVSPFRTLQAK